MISQDFLDKTRDLAYGEEIKYHTPSRFQIDYAHRKGEILAEILRADKNIVSAGMLLMDSMLGAALAEGRPKEHAKIGEERTKELFSEFPELSEEEKTNVIHCIREHHGAEKFFSIESEICCNADCYKFLSLEGVVGGMKHQREMERGAMIDLFLAKAEEKWNALSLPQCKKELEPQYHAVKILLEKMKENENQ